MHVYDLADNGRPARRRDGRVVAARRGHRGAGGRGEGAGPRRARGAHRRAPRGRRRPRAVRADPEPGRHGARPSRPVRPGDQRRGRLAAALAGRRQLHDPRARFVLGQRAGQLGHVGPASARGPRRRRRAARRRPHLGPGADPGLPQRRPGRRVQVGVDVDRVARRPVRLRHRRRAGPGRRIRRGCTSSSACSARPATWSDGCRCCASASATCWPRPACGPTATPGASSSPRCGRCRATSCSRPTSATWPSWPRWSPTGPSTAASASSPACT